MKASLFKLSKPKMALAAGLVLVSAGLAGSLPFIYYEASARGSVANHSFPGVKPSVKTPAGAVLIEGRPVAISINSLGIKLPVINGYYDKRTRTWTLTSTSAEFAVQTAQPNNQSGNTFVYGHALNNIFGNLHLIKPGATATITTDNGYRFVYKFASSYATRPTDLSVLNYQGPPMLTIQTCSGSWWQNRQMYLFSYAGYQKA